MVDIPTGLSPSRSFWDCTALNIWDLRKLRWVNVLLTSIQVAGFFLVIAAGFTHASLTELLAAPSQPGIVTAAAIVFFVLSRVRGHRQSDRGRSGSGARSSPCCLLQYRHHDLTLPAHRPRSHGALMQAAWAHGHHAPRRFPALPARPAVAEALPGLEVAGWYGIAAPAKLPTSIFARLRAEIIGTSTRRTYASGSVTDGSEPVGSMPAEFRQ